jgi:hypothetical protein
VAKATGTWLLLVARGKRGVVRSKERVDLTRQRVCWALDDPRNWGRNWGGGHGGQASQRARKGLEGRLRRCAGLKKVETWQLVTGLSPCLKD